VLSPASPITGSAPSSQSGALPGTGNRVARRPGTGSNGASSPTSRRVTQAGFSTSKNQPAFRHPGVRANVAFFDGHVELFNSADFQLNAGKTDNALQWMVQTPIFYLNQQNGKTN